MGSPHHQPRPPPTGAQCALPPRRAGEWSQGPGEPSASLHRPRRREGGSEEGATQTVALGKLRPQFFQVCLSERRGVGARLGDLPSRRRPPPRALGSPTRAAGAGDKRGARAREPSAGGMEGAPACAHNEVAETHTFPRGRSRASISRPARRRGGPESRDRK